MLNKRQRHLVRNGVLVAIALIFLLFAASLFAPFYHEVCDKNQYTGHHDCSTYRIAVAFEHFGSSNLIIG
jgi:hypothetical protein